ncbi:GTP cyclohydrolase II [Tumebacillus lipolyticus]|uniref:GTP cyclohydrolase II n=1 Tax=Tumebacillus lipolyticus TaxID=1280370 RepID=A0ABW4ZVD9_9BACL
MLQKMPEQITETVQEFLFLDKRYAILGPIRLPIAVREEEHTFRWYGYAQVPADVELDVKWVVELSERQQTFSSFLVYGDFERHDLPAVRVHSVCQTGDVFGSLRCDCGPQLQRSLQKIVELGAGCLIYLTGQEGRGIGLLAKALTYKLQEGGADTFEANRLLGCPDDARDYEEAAAMLYFLREQRPVTLLTNNPRKLEELRRYGIATAVRGDHTVPASPHNRHYLRAKIASGHVVDEEKLERSISPQPNL